MANQFLLKYSATAGVVPTSAELPLRQIALNTADGKLFIKKNDGTILSFESASAFARAVHTHVISDVTGLQSALDTLTSAAAAAQSGADASLKIASNLSDLASVSAARTNLSVDSSSEVDGKIATSKSASDAYTDAAIAALINGSPATLDTLKEIADALAAGSDVATALASSIAGVSSRVTTLEGQNLDSRLSTAEGEIDTLQTDVVAAQSAADAAQGTADQAVLDAAAAQSAADAAQSTADSAVSAAATAQAGADASLKIAANLSDLADAAASRSNLSVDSSAEVDTKVSNAVSSASSTLQSSIDGVSGRVSTLEGQNLDSRLTSAEGSIAGLGTMSAQDANNVNITGGLIGAGSVPTDSGVILTENSTLDGGTFSGFNGGGGGGNTTPVIGAYFYASSGNDLGTLANWYGDIAMTQAATQLPDGTTDVTLLSSGSADLDTWTQPQSINIGSNDLTLTSVATPSANLTCSVTGTTGIITLNGVAFNR
jgi:hypothetical protein